MRHPLVALLIGVALAAGNFLESRMGLAAPPAPRRLRYGPDPVQSIDLWLPDPVPAAPVPLVIFIHGGGWSMGSKDKTTGAAKILHFTGRGTAFASVGYRLVPRVRVEDQAADVASAIAHLLHAVPDLPIDLRRIVLMGHSAGAHLAALVGTDPAWLAAEGIGLDAIGGVIAVEGAAYDAPLQIRDAPLLLRPLYTQAFGRDPARWQRLSPVARASAPNVANWLLLHADRADGNRQTDALAASLRRAGSTVDVQQLPGHGLTGHIASNRRLGDPAYPGTATVDHWLARVQAGLLLRQVVPG